MQDIFAMQFNSRIKNIHVMENCVSINPSIVMSYVNFKHERLQLIESKDLNSCEMSQKHLKPACQLYEDPYTL